ncbi:hypothetical protein CR513_07754, partial [Mucuna pruriens]
MKGQEEAVQGIFHMKAKNSKGGKHKKKNGWKNKKPKGFNNQQEKTFPPCKKTNLPQRKCYWRSNIESTSLNQRSLSVSQLVERHFKVIFENNWCLVKDAKGRDIFKVKMRVKSHHINLMEEEQVAFSRMTNNDKWIKAMEEELGMIEKMTCGSWWTD